MRYCTKPFTLSNVAIPAPNRVVPPKIALAKTIEDNFFM
jgi:hypothetical protein